MVTLKKILCPVDHSECSYLALKFAISLALKDEAKLYLMHVIDTRFYNTEIFKFSNLNKQAEEDNMHKIREDLMKSLPEGTTDVLEVETIVVRGVPYKEIVDAAKDIGADLIVLGTHGRTGISHITMGSVAEKVVRNAHCPVLTVRLPATANKGEN